MLEIRNIRLNLDEDLACLQSKIAQMLGTADFTYSITKESLDARKRRHKQDINFLYQVQVSLLDKSLERKLLNHPDVSYGEEETIDIRVGEGIIPGQARPVIVGFGPAGMFAAYLLAQYGYRPIVIERGEEVDKRQASVERFWSDGILDTESNVQFGEGGAGTFSDGKLTSRSKDPWAAAVKEIFIKHGAPADIIYSHESHIGTDLLRDVVKNMRQQIITWGGEIHFSTRLDSVVLDRDGRLNYIETSLGKLTGPLFLAIGHSARDTFRMLVKAGLRAEPKPFAVGFRIEHPQALINEARFGVFKNHPRLGAASYFVKSKMDENGRNAYSFCMCPGGMVIQASSEEGRLVTNGMSYHARDGEFANSAILTGVRGGRDFGEDLLAGLVFQEKIEEQAYILGGKSHYAPAQTVKDFLKESIAYSSHISGSQNTNISCSFRPGIVEKDLSKIYSADITHIIARSLIEMNKQIPGFIGHDAHLIGVETRSSSPLRWIRNPVSYEAEGSSDIYPIGEGAGYAGGIISAGLDGLRSAAQFMTKYKPS